MKDAERKCDLFLSSALTKPSLLYTEYRRQRDFESRRARQRIGEGIGVTMFGDQKTAQRLFSASSKLLLGGVRLLKFTYALRYSQSRYSRVFHIILIDSRKLYSSERTETRKKIMPQNLTTDQMGHAVCTLRKDHVVAACTVLRYNLSAGNTTSMQCSPT